MTKVPHDKNEIMIVHQDGRASFCFKEFNPENPEYGWCYTRSNYYDAKNPIERSDKWGWGYCSKDCYLDLKKTGTTLRILEDVEVTSPVCHIFIDRF